jgi:hypothetical protein
MNDEGQLFDMEADSGQTSDVAASYSAEAAMLSGELARWESDAVIKSPVDNRPFPVGFHQFPITQLPARDGKPHGGIERSNRYPNDSFFRNWKNLDDSMTWDIEVATAGRYEVTIMFTCSPENLGATIAVEFMGHRIEGTATIPNDPPLRGMENDRVPRIESYVKDFKPMILGIINLPSGRGPLRLRALEIPGAAVLDVQAVHLTLVD